MPLQKIGINLSAVENVSLPNIAFKNTTAEFLDDIPAKANEVSGGNVGLIILIGLFTYLYWKLSQENFYGGDMGLSNLRSMGISASVCSIMGLVCLNLGYFSNYFHVVLFIVVSVVSVIAVWKAEK